MAAPALRDLDGHDPYELLGVPRSAGKREIIAAYRRQIRKVHPDLTSAGGEQAVLLGVARAVLLDPLRRVEYDLTAGWTQRRTDSVIPMPPAWQSEDVEVGPGPPIGRPTHIPHPRMPPPPEPGTGSISMFAVASVTFGALSLATPIEPLSSIPAGVISISCAAPCLVRRCSVTEVKLVGVGIACSILGITLAFIVAIIFVDAWTP